MSAPQDDRRVFPRYPIDVRVSVVFMKKGALTRSSVRSLEIGESGLSVSSPLELPVGEGVEVEFMLPGSRSMMRLKALVRNRAGSRYGIEFLSLSEPQKLDIRAIGERNMRASKAAAPATTTKS